MSGNAILGYKSLTECVMDYLKKSLNDRSLKPGDEINLSDLSKIVGVSRTPIREALIQLVKDGFIEIVSRRKFIIKRLTLKEIKDIYEMIGLLEAEASQTACDKMTDKDIQELEGLYNGMQE